MKKYLINRACSLNTRTKHNILQCELELLLLMVEGSVDNLLFDAMALSADFASITTNPSEITIPFDGTAVMVNVQTTSKWWEVRTQSVVWPNDTESLTISKLGNILRLESQPNEDLDRLQTIQIAARNATVDLQVKQLGMRETFFAADGDFSPLDADAFNTLKYGIQE